MPEPTNILESLYDAVILADAKGAVRECNGRALDLLGYTRAELCQMDMVRLVSGITAELLRTIEQQLKVGRFTVLEGRCIRKNGSMFPAEIAVGAISFPDGGGFCFSLRNITQRRLTEEKIRREIEAQLQRARQQKDFSGQLNIIGLPELIQFIDSSGKSGRLEVHRSSDGAVATLGFEAGQIVTAACGAERGPAAVFAVLRFAGDSFSFHQDAVLEKDPAITATTMGLLLEGLRYVDEAAASVAT
jgi:PAS domain S-box-containing protein